MQSHSTSRLQERCGRWLLLLVLLHSVPVLWITPVAAGTAPTVALLGVGIASLFTFDAEGLALGLLALLPGLAYALVGWAIAWLLGKLARRLRPTRRGALLACLVVPLLAAVYFPIYIAGGHNASSSADLLGLVGGSFSRSTLLAYWLVLHCVLALLFAGALLRDDHVFAGLALRWGRPVSIGAGLVTLALVVSFNHAVFLCRPLAMLGVGRAQVCVAKSATHDKRYWYERAALRGNVEALAWLVENTPNREVRLKWLRLGAEQGDPASQFALYRFLLRTPGAEAEAEHWLELAADGDHPEAQMEFADRLTKELDRHESIDRLEERKARLERAAELGSRTAKLRLAQHHTDGSMGYPADFDRARDYYRELLSGDEPTQYEAVFGLDSDAYQKRLDELDAWQKGLEQRDPSVMKTVAKKWLGSRMPGPGVRERARGLMEELAEAGDREVREELTLALRTGSLGVDQDLEAAKRWLLAAAREQDPEAMARVADNYMSGREGFPVDYPQARHWIDVQIAYYETQEGGHAQARLGRLKQALAYIDRLGDSAGHAMLGHAELAQLGARSDAQSKYEHAIQLLVGHGNARRAEAIAGLQEAARMGHGAAAWRLFQVYDHGFPQEIDKAAALETLKLAVANHHFDATRELAENYENGKRGLPVDLPRAISLYEAALEAGRDNRYGWDLDPDNFNHFRWLESRLRQARLKLNAQAKNGDQAVGFSTTM